MNETRDPRVFDDVRMFELNPGMKIFALLLIFCGALARGTTVNPVDHTCPICGTVSITMQLGSYSQFGEPAHDLSDRPEFTFYGVDVCPNDLFASWKSNWDKVGPEDKARLSEFLKHPAVVLTAQEKAIVGDHLDELRTSRWWEDLWARSCDAVRQPDSRHRWYTAMSMNYTGLVVRSDWERKLAVHFREQAILQLQEGAVAAWTSDEEKRYFPYLRAELTRQAGRLDEAKSLFLDVIAHEKTFPADPDTAWISRWAGEQLALIDKAPVAHDPPVAVTPPAAPVRDETNPQPPQSFDKEKALVEIKTTQFLTRDDLLNSKDPEIIKAMEERVERLRHTQAKGAEEWARGYEIMVFETLSLQEKLLQLPIR